MNPHNHTNTVASHKAPYQPNWLFFALAALFVGLYLFNISGWLIHDDEGTDLYEAWQLQVGSQPGVDFIAEQQPLFLQIGKTGLSLFEDSTQAVKFLRISAAVQVLAGAFFLGLVVKHFWGARTAALTMGLILTSGLTYEQARLYRPDPMMFAWELLGFGFVLLAVQTGKRPFWAAAGVAYGIAVLMKLFGLFPVVGLVLFFLYLFIAQTKHWRQHLLNGIAFALPFLIISGGISLLLYGQMGFYYQEAFNQHLSLGQQKTIWDQLYITGGNLLLFIVVNAFALFIILLAIMNRRSGVEMLKQPVKALLYTQPLVPIFFLLITRPLHPRYFIFLLPALALLFARQFMGFLDQLDQNQPKTRILITLLILLPIGLSFFFTYPTTVKRLVRQEDDTIALAHYIQANTQPEDVVVSDYASLNFHAKRPSIYEASIIAGGRIGGEIVTGALLIQHIEETQAKMVIVHVSGGDPPPHQLNHLVDFPVFEAYLAEKYEMIRLFDRAGQILEIYERK